MAHTALDDASMRRGSSTPYKPLFLPDTPACARRSPLLSRSTTCGADLMHEAAHGSGSSSTQSSSGGSGNSSPQRDEDLDTLPALVPPVPLAGQPSSDELDMWEVLMSLDGARAAACKHPHARFILHPSFVTKDSERIWWRVRADFFFRALPQVRTRRRAPRRQQPRRPLRATPHASLQLAGNPPPPPRPAPAPRCPRRRIRRRR